MSQLKVKIITGYGDDQKFIIPAEEAHKAYYLFRHPEERGIFSNGLALIGKDIREIVPDWHASMGWNPSHKLDDDDWNEINGKIRAQMAQVMDKAVALIPHIENDKRLLTMPMSSIATPNLPQAGNDDVKQLAEKMSI